MRMGLPQFAPACKSRVMSRELLRILLVIMQIIYIRHHMEIAAGVDTGSGGVKEFCHLPYDPQ